MAKSLEQINREYLERKTCCQPQNGYAAKQKKLPAVAAVLSDILFYGAIFFLLLVAAVFTMNDDTNRSLAGYSVFQILSSSMESVYPKGSLVLVKETDVTEIMVGDDITFMMNETDTATHRVIEIAENYDGGQARGFKTQGTENARPDEGYVDERNAIGRVIFCVPMLGFILEQILENLLLVFIMFILAVILSFALRVLWGDKKQRKEQYLSGLN